jgi:hypothetical protein
MNLLLRPGYGRPSVRPRVLVPATYHLGTPQDQSPAVAPWHIHLRGLLTSIHETSWLALLTLDHNKASKLRSSNPKAGCLLLMILR